MNHAKETIPYITIIISFMMMFLISEKKDQDIEVKVEKFRKEQRQILDVDSLRSVIEQAQRDSIDKVVSHYEEELRKRDRRIDKLERKENELEKKYDSLSDALGELPRL